MARVLHQVASTARRHRMFRRGDRVVVAVSGGPDSLCLLHALVRLRGLLGIDPVCFHFDHRLRPDSAADAGYVRRQAARLGVPFLLRRAGGGPPAGSSVEAWARTARYGALNRVLEEVEASVAAVGHTRDDRAETVLLALLRGGGLEALTGMRAVSPPVVRPLLETTREQTVAFCRSLGLRPRQDPTNRDPAYMRGALRQVLPALEEALGRDVRAPLARTAALAERDADLLEALALQAEPDVVAPEGADLRLRADRLAALPLPLAARVVRRALRSLGALPEAGHLEAVVALADARPGRTVSLPLGLKARREREYVRLSRPSPAGGPGARSRGTA